MQNNKTQQKRRTKTKNQKRIEKLLEEYPASIEGLNKTMLQLPNCPKKVRISTVIIDLENDQINKENRSITRKVTKRELICFMIKKFNIFLDHSSVNVNENKNANKNEKEREIEWIQFRPSSQNNLDTLITMVDSEEFDKQFGLITKRLRYWYEQDSTNFQGIESAHLSDSYRIPYNVIIDKDLLKKFCAEISPTDQSSQIKKVYRAFSFFFLARFNCINSTHKNRKKMIFSRNYQFGQGKTQSNNNKIGVTLPNTKNAKKSVVLNVKQPTKHVQIKRKRKRKLKTSRAKLVSTKQLFVEPDYHYSSSSSGEEIERETSLPQKQARHKERRIITTQERKTQKNIQIDNGADNHFHSLQQLQSKTEQELEGELVWLLVNLKSHYRN
ncbi:hypothetical protein M0813_30229 [Anaeramoeba flamelloides]|uniref:Uncharacterized protein n=1 Tax=Anaeramoeba flamelloides TaxID=1746091 RepID=A0ABQ8XKF3_9EUKA|nr:hypothetical protein M0813_30229 [Anaeramoeba flamelloides]